MPDVVKCIEYYYTVVPDRPGAGAEVLDALKTARVNLLAFTGFPCGARRAQLDFVPWCFLNRVPTCSSPFCFEEC